MRTLCAPPIAREGAGRTGVQRHGQGAMDAELADQDYNPLFRDDDDNFKVRHVAASARLPCAYCLRASSATASYGHLYMTAYCTQLVYLCLLKCRGVRVAGGGALRAKIACCPDRLRHNSTSAAGGTKHQRQ